MKLLKLKLKELFIKKLAIIICFTFMSVALSSCLDDDGVTAPDLEPVAYVALYNGSPDAPSLDVFVDNNRINSGGLDYADHTGYLRFFTGDRTLKFTPYNASNTLVDTTATFEEETLYSVFITGEESDLETLITEDEFPESSEGNAVVRIVHLSPDVPAVNLFTGEDSEEPFFENVAYQSASDFVTIPPGNTTLKLTSMGEGETLATVSDYKFVEDRVYTIVVRGYQEPPAGNGNALSVQVFMNFFNY